MEFANNKLTTSIYPEIYNKNLLEYKKKYFEIMTRVENITKDLALNIKKKEVIKALENNELYSIVELKSKKKI